MTLERLAPHTKLSPRALYEAVYDGPLEDAFESGRLDQVAFLEEARKVCQLTCDTAFMAGAFADIFEPNAEVCDLLPQLKRRYRLLLGSNTNELHSAKFLDQFQDVLSVFDAIVLSYRIGVRKPRREFFEHCRQLANCPGEACLFLDDLPANIAGARAAGLQGLVYRRGENLAAQLRALGVAW